MNIIFTDDDNIDWHANGWPEPNPDGIPYEDDYTLDGMPDEIFDEWQLACDELS